MEDGKTKKHYNPFPDEPEEGNTLVSEDDIDTAPKPESDIDDQINTEEQLEPIATPALEDEVIEEEEEELERTVSEQPKPKKKISDSWMYPAIGVTGFLIVFDYGLNAVARELFWSIRGAYISSIAFRVVLLILIQYFWLGKRIVHERVVWYTVFGSIGFAAGLAAGIMRFVANPEFWTFINLILEPIDTTLLAVGASYIVFSITMPSTNIKQTV